MTTSKTSFVGSLVVSGAMATVSLLTAFGLKLSGEQVTAITGAAGFMGLMLTLILWAQTVPREQVLEALIGDEVVAGPANDVMREGDVVRVLPRRAA